MSNNINKWKSITPFSMLKPVQEFLADRRKSHTVYPKPEDILNIFKFTDPDDIKIVIVGQDPYPSEHADGLAFSSKEKNTPVSLENIFKEIYNNVGAFYRGYPFEEYFPTNNLEIWAKKGILLLNRVMSVDKGEPTSHAGKGWEEFTGKILSVINNSNKPTVFMLWGNYAKASLSLLDNPIHSVLTGVHPAARDKYSFAGNRHFIQALNFLLINERVGKPFDYTKTINKEHALKGLKHFAECMEYDDDWYNKNKVIIEQERLILVTESIVEFFTTNKNL